MTTLKRGFNPRSRVGSDSVFVWFCTSLLCFNPRSRVGSDPIDSEWCYTFTCFNPRSRVGSDCGFSECPGFAVGVSIHAPAWGATADFNPNSVEGMLFQSTLPRGERRPIVAEWSYTFFSFNPRSRVGSDRQIRRRRKSRCSFNPRSRVGSDRGSAPNPGGSRSFNPRSRVGSDAQLPGVAFLYPQFQSTLPRGERQSQ